MSNQNVKAKILHIDIETAPALGWVWGKWEQNVIDFDKYWYILSFAAKWHKDNKVIVKGLIDYKEYNKDKENDKKLVEDIWKLLDEADIVCGHNLDLFDIKKINARFTYYNIKPPSPYKTVDTLKVARKYFKFDSNKLDDVARFLNLGQKVHHTGFELWKGCMKGEKKSWNLMKNYNKNDTLLLEKLYIKLLPWMSGHPNVGMFKENGIVCPKCGSDKTQSRGYIVNKTTKYKRAQCQNCGGWFKFGPNLRKEKPAVSI